MRIIREHWFGEIISGLDHPIYFILFVTSLYLVSFLMLLLQCSRRAPLRVKSCGHPPVVNFDLTILNVFVYVQKENTDLLYVKLA